MAASITVNATTATTGCLMFNQTCVPYFHHFIPSSNSSYNSSDVVSDPATLRYHRLIVGIPGLETTSEDFCSMLQNTVQLSTACATRSTLVACPDLGSSAYNLIETQLIGTLNLKDIVDGFVEHFRPTHPAGKKGRVVVTGFSKGSQSVQRYSLVNGINHTTTNTSFLLGCASSFTLLDPTVDYRCGLASFPSGFFTNSSAESILNQTSLILMKSNFRVACGSLDTGSSSDACTNQGASRLERSQNLFLNLVDNGIRADFVTVDGAGHNFTEVIGAQGEFLCS